MKDMERFGSINKSVGMPEDGNEKLEERSQARFEAPLEFIDEKEELEEISRPKTPEEIKLHERADEISNSILEKYDLDLFSLPEKNVLIVKRGQWPEEVPKDAGGLYNPEAQLIALEESPIRMEYAKNLLHEQLHFKSYNALQAVTDKEKKTFFTSDYRVGLTIRTRDGEQLFFRNINEAITEELVKRHSDELFADPVFSEERQQFKTMQEANQRMKEQGQTDRVMGVIDNPDTIYANIFFADSEMADILAPDRGEGEQVFHSVQFSYPKQREVLQELTEKIYERNEDEYEDPAEVFDEFARAALSGRLLPLAKLVDNTFGSGTFRNLGEADPDIDELQAVVDGLEV